MRKEIDRDLLKHKDIQEVLPQNDVLKFENQMYRDLVREINQSLDYPNQIYLELYYF